VRKDAGLTCRSVVDIKAADGERYAAIIDGKVAMKIGPGAWDPGAGWEVKVDGNDFAVWRRQWGKTRMEVSLRH
jgi:alpha-amylase